MAAQQLETNSLSVLWSVHSRGRWKLGGGESEDWSGSLSDTVTDRTRTRDTLEATYRTALHATHTASGRRYTVAIIAD